MSATSPSLAKIVAKTDAFQTTSPTVNGTQQPDAPDNGRYVSKEVYWAKFYEHPDASYEWNNGILEAKPLPNQPTKLNLNSIIGFSFSWNVF